MVESIHLGDSLSDRWGILIRGTFACDALGSPDSRPLRGIKGEYDRRNIKLVNGPIGVRHRIAAQVGMGMGVEISGSD